MSSFFSHARRTRVKPTCQTLLLVNMEHSEWQGGCSVNSLRHGPPSRVLVLSKSALSTLGRGSCHLLPSRCHSTIYAYGQSGQWLSSPLGGSRNQLIQFWTEVSVSHGPQSVTWASLLIDSSLRAVSSKCINFDFNEQASPPAFPGISRDVQ